MKFSQHINCMRQITLFVYAKQEITRKRWSYKVAREGSGSRSLHAQQNEQFCIKNEKKLHTCHYSWCALGNGRRRCSHGFNNFLNWRCTCRCFRLFRDSNLCASVANVTDDRWFNVTRLSAWSLLGQRRFLFVWRHFE